jgi:uncharacterized glyoxalase superfamily protein PhnB/quercetin dioxygenase-like cupin family protein
MTVQSESSATPAPVGAAATGGLTPILVYEDIEAAHDYLINVFGFTSGGLFRDPDGVVIHGEVRMGDAAVWLHRVTDEHQMGSPRQAATSHGGLEVTVENVDGHYDRANRAGARIDRRPEDQPYGLREYAARDLENHRWWFSSGIGNDDSRRRPVILGPGEGRHYPMGRLSATFKADGVETAGRYGISEWWLDPHTKGPGPHAHPDDDVFYVLSGTMSIFVDGEWNDAPAGSIVVVPGNVLHDFENRSDQRAGMLNVSAPGNFEQRLPDIAQWFRDRSDADALA